MKTILILLACFWILSCDSQTSMSATLENYMDAHAEINNFSGTVLVTKNDSILLKKAYGFADYEWKVKNTIDTKFSLASVSKQFTSVAILQLAENNKLSLDDRLSKFYPNIPNGEFITIRMLLNHSSGVADDVDPLFNSNARITKDSVVNYIAEKPALFYPGSKTQYSNVGYFILATIIEKVSGQAFSEYMQRHVFKIAKMTHSGVSSLDSIFHQMARVYHYEDDILIKSPPCNWDINIGLDGIFSTVEDLYLWNKQLYEDTILISGKSKQEMFTPYNDDVFGFGVLINPFYNHNQNLIGHDGGYYGTQSSLNKFPDENVFITVLSNNGSPSYLLAYGLSAIVFGKTVELPYNHISVEIDKDIYSDYVGEYDGIKIFMEGDKLFYSNRNIELIPESETKFYRRDNDDRTVEFVKDKNGKVSHIVISKVGVLEIKLRE